MKLFKHPLRSLVVSVLSVAALTSAAWTGDDGRPSTPAITARDLAWHIRYLASDELKGRFTATPGARQAAAYIAAEFRRYGLRPVGDAGSYFQHFPFIAGVHLGEENRLEATLNGRHRRWRVKEDFMPMSFSTEGAAELEAVFVGYGISAPEAGYDEYASVDVHGRLVLALRYTPEGNDPHGRFGRYASFRAKALMARQHGARAIAFIADAEDFQKSRLAQLEFDYSFADSGILALGLSRQAAEEMIGAAGMTLDDLKRAIDTAQRPRSRVLPGVRVRLQVDLVKEEKRAANVVGYVEGSDPALKDEVIIIGAHYDHLGLGGPHSLAPKQVGQIHNGADDNASGTSGLLELAEALAAERSTLKRSLLFIAFSGEEEGLLGSSYYVKHPIIPLEQTVAMINLDMIGRLRQNRLIIQGLGTSPAWKPLIEKLNRTAKFDLRTGSGGVGSSDHTSFYLKDIPVLFFFTGVHSDYHKPTDDADKINVDGEARVVRFVHEAVLRIQAWPTRPAFTRTQPAMRSSRGFRVSLGTIPDYAEEVEGVKLSGIREGSPAEKAGLQAGDIVVRVKDIQIKNIYDYTFALGELQPGEEVEIEVLRGERRLVLKIVPEAR